MLYVVCVCNKLFTNVSIGEQGRVVDGSHFNLSCLYWQLNIKKILCEPVVEIARLQIYPYIFGDAGYLIPSYLLNYYNPRADVERGKIKFDYTMNSVIVSIKTNSQLGRIVPE